jgi:hypothetical protein
VDVLLENRELALQGVRVEGRPFEAREGEVDVRSELVGGRWERERRERRERRVRRERLGRRGRLLIEQRDVEVRSSRHGGSTEERAPVWRDLEG